MQECAIEKTTMNFAQNDVSPARRFGGLIAVTLLHVLIAYALITGLAHKLVDVVRQPVEVTIIEDIKPPPPDKPPPLPPPKPAAPPPPFIPPPEVQIQPPAEPNPIQSKTEQAPPHQDFIRPADAPPAPVAAPVRVAPVVTANACEIPPYPKAAQRMGEEGVVALSILIGADGRVSDSRVVKSSGSKNLDRATQAGLSLCKFKPGSLDGKPVEMWVPFSYRWRLPDE